MSGPGYRKRYIKVIKQGVGVPWVARCICSGVRAATTPLHWERSSTRGERLNGPIQWCCECATVTP